MSCDAKFVFAFVDIHGMDKYLTGCSNSKFVMSAKLAWLPRFADICSEIICGYLNSLFDKITFRLFRKD